MNLADFIRKDYRYAVVGATTNKEKYGFRVLKDLHGAGFRVVGVNPKYETIDGIPCYPNLAAVPEKPDVAIFVIPPTAAAPPLEEADRLGIRKIWFQPGAESDEILTHTKQLGLLTNDPRSCIMVDRKRMKM